MADLNIQLSMFDGEGMPDECCRRCEHFAEFKEARTYTNRDGDFGVFGMCCKSFNRNGSYSMYPIYIPGGKCKDFKKRKEKDGERNRTNGATWRR